MYHSVTVIALVCLAFKPILAQEFIHFPQDVVETVDNVTSTLAELRGTTVYEKFVDNIISGGITKLTLAVDRASLKNSGRIHNENIVFSPVSIAGALALVLLGSNGKTFDEIATIMGLATGVDIQGKSQRVHEQLSRLFTKLEKTSGFDLNNEMKFASAIFVQNNYPIRSIYKQTSEALYKSEVLNLDFKSNPENAQKIINAWVADRTNSKINSILNEPPPSETKVILASALYFKAEWEKPFFEGATRKKPFFTNGRKSKSDIEVEMMANGGTFPYFRDSQLNCQILGFPYKGNKTTMYIIMPDDSSKERLHQLEKTLVPSELERLVNSTKYTAAVILFPKMKIENTIDLRDVLRDLGVRSLFNPSTANLAILSPGIESVAAGALNNIGGVIKNPIAASVPNSDEGVLIFSRIGEPVNCTEIFQPNSTVNSCQQVLPDSQGVGVVYKRIGDKIGRQVKHTVDKSTTATIDSIRHLLNQQPNSEHAENPGLYADKVLHKVYMDITESGTEAAAATSVSLSRDGGRVTFRVDVPFLFFIRHEETKMILFWGSVSSPTPSFT